MAVARFKATVDGRLTSKMLAAYRSDGFLVLEDMVGVGQCRALMAEADRLIDEFDAEAERTVFSAVNQSHADDSYFRTSGDKIRFFLEAEAVDKHGRLMRPKAEAINKIGHALHDLNPVFNRFSRQPALARLVADLGLARPLLLQSMQIRKPPHIGGEVGLHQDAAFLYTEPISVVGLWVALQDATQDNGCLWAIPGGQDGPLRSRFRYCDGGLATESLDPTPLAADLAEPLETSQGTLVVLHGLLPHRSGANRSSDWRQAYALHVIDGACRYAEDNWLRRGTDMPLRGF
jgi:phytanoyl-CoA hydroxylase